MAAIAAGAEHTCALSTAGALKCWGLNDDGQLGDGTTTNRTMAVDVVGLGSGVAAVAMGTFHTCALTTAGSVKCWGHNIGRLGDGTTTQRTTPVDVCATGATAPCTAASGNILTGVAAVAAGGNHTCTLTTAGGVKCWGPNFSGELGDGTTALTTTPVDVCAMAATAPCTAANSNILTGVAAVAAGGSHTCALTTAGGLKCWGANITGQLGDGTTTDRTTPVDVSGLTSGVAAVAAGKQYSCALTTAGGLKCWGLNNFGQLGDGTFTGRTTPVDVVGLTSGVAAVAAGGGALGGGHTCALTTAGGVKCWGLNSQGQLGDGTFITRNTQLDVCADATCDSALLGVASITAGFHHTCAVTAAGGVECWGENSDGQLGAETTELCLLDIPCATTPVDVAELESGVASVAAGTEHTCALTTGAGVKCWGRNNWAQLGDGTTTNRTTPVDVSGLTSGVAAVAAGNQHTCAVTTGAGLKCWGRNLEGQLGDGTFTGRATPVDVVGLTSGVANVAAGVNHSCARTTVGGLKCWGENGDGQLGDGTTTDRTTPVDVSGLTSGVAAVVAGGSHTCALTTAGGLKCWGSNSAGQLGDGTTTQRTTPVDVSGLTSGVAAVAAGGSHSCALTTAGGVKCWGLNGNGQLGDGTTTQRTTPVDVVGLTSGVGTVAPGGSHTCGVTTAGTLKCWGMNANGQLGDGTTTDSTTPMDVTSLTSGAAAVAAGTEHTCALTTGGAAKCWGKNNWGQLGDTTTTDRTTPVDVIGFDPLDPKAPPTPTNTATDTPTPKSTPTPKATPTANPTAIANGSLMSIDGDCEEPATDDTSVEPTRSVLVGDTFQVCVFGVFPTSGAAGYQARVHWSEAVLDLNARTAGTNDLWHLQPVSAGGAPNGAIVSQTLGPMDNGAGSDAYIQVQAVDSLNQNASPRYEGPVAQLEFVCQSNGSANIDMRGPGVSTYFIDAGNPPVKPSLAGAVITCLEPAFDSDRDGCTNQQEFGDDERLGGRRDPLNFWDFYDTPNAANVRDKQVDLFNDIFAVALRFGASGDPGGNPLTGPIPAAPTYHSAFDRGPPTDANGIITGAADGNIDLFNDIFGVAFQFGHNCQAPP